MTIDSLIVGAGPAGLMSAYYLGLKHREVVVADEGHTLNKRVCPSIHLDKKIKCPKCPVCDIISGYGGAGLFSDGKIIISDKIGGDLKIEPDEKELLESIFTNHQDLFRVYKNDSDRVKWLASRYGLQYLPSTIYHLGSDNGIEFLRRLYNVLIASGVNFMLNTLVLDILPEKDYYVVMMKTKNEITKVKARNVVIATGRKGSTFTTAIARKLGIPFKSSKVDIGVRVEVPYGVTKDITDEIYEFKFVYYGGKYNDRVRTFCVNPRGIVVYEGHNGYATVNGLAYSKPVSDNTNFAILVTTEFTEPFNDSIEYGRAILFLSELLAKGPILQRLGDLKRGRRSTDKRIKENSVVPTLPQVVAGDLSFVLPSRYMTNILDMLERLNKVMPGINDDQTLLYGPEVKFYSNKFEVSNEMETKYKGLYIIGDTSGHTRGIYQSMISGIRAGKSIVRNKR